MRILFSIAFLLFTINAHAQWMEASVQFKNGEILEGYVSNPDLDDKKVKFRSTKDGSNVTYKSILIKKLHLISKDNNHYLLENIKPERGKEIFMQLVIEGPVNLYVVSVITSTVGRMDNYYLKRSTEEKAAAYNGIGARKHAIEYFKDDEEVVTYLKTTPLLSIDMFEVVRMYNRNKSI